MMDEWLEEAYTKRGGWVNHVNVHTVCKQLIRCVVEMWSVLWNVSLTD